MGYTNYLQAVEVDKDLCLTIAMEECAELIQAISKAKRGKLNRDNLVEEIADVRLCINWLLSIFDIKLEEELDLINYKRDRVVKRLNKGEFK